MYSAWQKKNYFILQSTSLIKAKSIPVQFESFIEKGFVLFSVKQNSGQKRSKETAAFAVLKFWKLVSSAASSVLRQNGFQLEYHHTIANCV